LDEPVTVFDVVRRLPDVPRVREISQAIALLDAILSPDWSSRYFSFDAEWAPGEALASMRNGSGDEYSIVFTAAGACARGFDHESPMSPYRRSPLATWPGLLDTVPEVFRDVVTEPAFSEEDGTLLATVVFWRRASDPAWSCGDVSVPAPAADGADELFALLADGRPEGYQEFAQEYYAMDVDLPPVQHCYRLRPLTRSVVAALNPDLELADLEADRQQIGYPAPAERELPDRPRRSPWGWPLL
jgi:hypothetical protein